MKHYFLKNLSELAQKRAVIIREEAQLWDILARDLKREAGRLDEAPATAKPRIPPAEPRTPENDEDEKLFVRISEAARIMGLGRSSLYKEIAESRLKVRKAGRKTLIAVADIHAWFNNLPHGSGQ